MVPQTTRMTQHTTCHCKVKPLQIINCNGNDNQSCVYRIKNVHKLTILNSNISHKTNDDMPQKHGKNNFYSISPRNTSEPTLTILGPTQIQYTKPISTDQSCELSVRAPFHGHRRSRGSTSAESAVHGLSAVIWRARRDAALPRQDWRRTRRNYRLS